MVYDGLFKDWFKQRRKSLDLTQKVIDKVKAKP